LESAPTRPKIANPIGVPLKKHPQILQSQIFAYHAYLQKSTLYCLQKGTLTTCNHKSHCALPLHAQPSDPTAQPAERRQTEPPDAEWCAWALSPLSLPPQPVCACMCLCVNMRLYVFVCVCMCVFVCMHMYVRVFICVRVSVSVSACALLCMHDASKMKK
jgi:hypothetical protein